MSVQNLSRSIFRKILAVVVLTWMTGGVAFGWVGTTHSLLCQRNFDLPVVSQFLGGIDQGAVENYIGEPSQTSHNVQWELIRDRKYLSTSSACTNGFWLWSLNNETTRLQYLMHHLGDDGVPAHHEPAVYANPSKTAEGISEFAAAGGYLTVGELPNIANTSLYTNTRTGYQFDATGTISDITYRYFHSCWNNADFYSKNKTDVSGANWNALAIDLMLQRAVMVDYFLAKQNAVANPQSSYSPTLGNSFYGQEPGNESYDTDNISWNADGTFSYTGGGIVQYAWDFNNDAVFDHFSTNPTVTVSSAYLISLGCTPGAVNYYAFSVLDDEGKWSETVGSHYLPVGGVPEPATLGLLAVGGLGMLIRRKR